MTQKRYSAGCAPLALRDWVAWTSASLRTNPINAEFGVFVRADKRFNTSAGLWQAGIVITDARTNRSYASWRNVYGDQKVAYNVVDTLLNRAVDKWKQGRYESIVY